MVFLANSVLESVPCLYRLVGKCRSCSQKEHVTIGDALPPMLLVVPNASRKHEFAA